MTGQLRRRVLAGLAVLVALTPLTCRRTPAAPSEPDVSLNEVTGNGQFGPPSQFLIDSLTVSVTQDGGRPANGILVDWEVVSGPLGAQLTPTTTPSDSAGLAAAQLRLGSDLGKYVVRASIRDRPEESVDFEAWAVLPPTLGALSSDAVDAGDVIRLSGANFSAIAAHNVVLFSGIAGQVIAADTIQLDVTVPSCLPTRTVDVSVQLGGEASTSLPLSVTASAGVLDLALGADTTLLIQETPRCLTVGSDDPQEYLAVVQSTATIGAARFDYTFTGLRPAAPSSVALGPDEVDTVLVGTSLNAAQWEWEVALRERERLLATFDSTGGRTARTTPSRVPRIGESREFFVARGGGFDTVTAKVRSVSERAILYEDVAAEGSFTQEDVELFADLFDDPIYPVTTETFGSPSDLDGNDRVIVLFTPVVNRLSPPGSNGLIGGFFFALDLMPELDHSNAGEVFYVLVPDPTGAYGNVRDVDMIRRSVPPILAHEFQHMIHHNERIIELAAPYPDALWLSEGLAHMAEDLVGSALRERGRSAEADQYQRGNRKRASLFLTEPSDVSLISASRSGTLEERGAAWLFLEYLKGQMGSDSVFRSLTSSVLTGTVNVESVTGRDWASLFSDWSAALELERQILERGALPLRDELRFLGFDLMDALELGGDGFPTRPKVHVSGDFSDPGRVWSSSGAYFLLGTEAGGMGISLSGLNGGPPSRSSELRLKLVRVY